MNSSDDVYERIINFMKINGAVHEPLKTRDIAGGCKLSINSTRCYLQELECQYIVEASNYSKGHAIYWYLVN
ncbi:TPA: hypothetical protein JLM45_004798 [Escherichia coli]|nr:hypothetical protein [Escherichia coli]